MTLPTSKILKASKSLVAAANIKNQSPSTEQGQQQSVNIVVNSSTPDLRAHQKQINDIADVYDARAHANEQHEANGECFRRVVYDDKQTIDDDNPYKNINLRDLQEANQIHDDLSKLIQEKDNIIKAESIIIDIYRNNPLIVNKFVVAEHETLTELIKLLTNASDVSIELSDIECTCLSASYQTIKRVYLTVDEQVYSLEMCPAVMNFLEGFKISLNLVKI